MSTLNEVMAELKKLGSESTRKTLIKHGAPAENFFGVKIGDMKKIIKKVKGDQQLALDLYATGNSDAMYLAGLIADGSLMTKKQLIDWANAAPWYMIGEYTVPWVASENKAARELALKWMKAKSERVASTGWATYASLVSTIEDDDLDLEEIEELLDRIGDSIHSAPNRVRYTMNSFVICVGSYVKPLLPKAKAVAKKIGVVQVDMGGTACKVPAATEYIAKIEKMKRIGLKRKDVRC